MARSTRASAGAVLVAVGLLARRPLELAIRALHDPDRLTLLNGVVLRSRDEFGVDHYLALLGSRFDTVRSVLVLAGVLMAVSGIPVLATLQGRLLTAVQVAASAPRARVAVLVGAAVASRFGTIVWPSTIAVDEHSFLTVAQRLSSGELPYTTTLDNKPPLLAAVQSLPFVLGLDAFWHQRLYVALVIGVTAALVASVIRSCSGTASGGLFGGLAFIAGVGIAPAGGAAMSHHFANLLLAAMMVVALRISSSTRGLAAIGAGSLAAAVTLTRTNYAFPAALVLLLMLWNAPSGERSRIATRVAGGGLAVVTAVALPYVFAGALPNLLHGVWSILFGSGGRVAVGGSDRAPVWLPALLALFAVLFVRSSEPAQTSDQPRNMAGAPWTIRRWLPAVTMVGIVTSLMLHASLFDHYAGMLMIPLAVQAGLVLGRPPTSGASADSGRNTWPSVVGRLATVGLTLASVVLLGLSGTSGLLLDGGSETASRAEADVAAALQEHLAERPGSVYALTHHDVYWRLGLPPASPLATHPSAVLLEAFYAAAPLLGLGPIPTSPTASVNSILEGAPRYLVSSPGLTEGYLVQGLPDGELEDLRARIEEEWSVTWNSSDGAVVIRECEACG